MKSNLALIALIASAVPLAAQTADVMTGSNRPPKPPAPRDDRLDDAEVLRRLMNRHFGFENTTYLQPPNPASWMHSSTLVPTYNVAWQYQLPGIAGNSANPPSAPDATLLPLTATARRAGLPEVSQKVGPFDALSLPGAGLIYTLRVPREQVAADGGLVTFDPHAKRIGLNATCGQCHAGIAPEQPAAHAADLKAMANCATCHRPNTVAKPAPVSDWDKALAEVKGVKPLPTSALPPPQKARGALCEPGELTEQLAAVLFAHAKNVRRLDAQEVITVAVTFDELPGVKTLIGFESEPGFLPAELQAAALGELHAKQQKWKEAAAAYEKALDRFGGASIALASGLSPGGITETEATARGFYRQLAAAQLQLGEVDKAKASLDRAMNFKVELAAASPAKPSLPAKLVVSVTKAELDKAKSVAELRKALKVERVGFPDGN